MTLYLDYETRATVDIRTAGSTRYVNCPDFRVLCINYAVDDGAVVTVLGDETEKRAQFIAELECASRIVAHNIGFERLVSVALTRGRDAVMDANWSCTAARARRHGLPPALEDAAVALGLQHRKAPNGALLIRLLCRPRKDGTFCQDLALIKELAAYGAQDVEVMRELDERLPDLDPVEQLIFEYDQLLNARGVSIDLALLQDMQLVADQASEAVDLALQELSAMQVTSVNQRDRILTWLTDYVCPADDLSRTTVRTLLAQEQLKPEVRQMLELRAEGSRTSTRKLQAFADRQVDGKLYGSLLYYGAATGRHSSTGVQLQNLPRPERPWWMLQEAMQELRDADLDRLRLLYGPPLSLVADLLRCLIVPAAGYVFEICDLNAIELRVAAWIAGEDKLLGVIRAGKDVYCRMATQVFGREVLPSDERERFLGKTLQLAGQYGMGWTRFQKTCVAQGQPVDELLARRSIETYRQEHPAIVQAWVKLEAAARTAIERNKETDCGGLLTFEPWREWLLLHLPSSRPLYYFRPEVVRDDNNYKRIVYQGVNPTTHQFKEQQTWGGSLLENVVQAISRDVLMHGCFLLENEGHDVRLIVHDEVVCEVPARRADIERVAALMAVSPSWAPGLPLRAKGAVSERYRKL